MTKIEESGKIVFSDGFTMTQSDFYKFMPLLNLEQATKELFEYTEDLKHHEVNDIDVFYSDSKIETLLKNFEDLKNCINEIIKVANSKRNIQCQK